MPGRGFDKEELRQEKAVVAITGKEMNEYITAIKNALPKDMDFFVAMAVIAELHRQMESSSGAIFVGREIREDNGEVRSNEISPMFIVNRIATIRSRVELPKRVSDHDLSVIAADVLGFPLNKTFEAIDEAMKRARGREKGKDI